MTLPFREKLTMLMPPAWFYRRRIAEEVRTTEPEFALLPQWIARGGTALDVGANQGLFSFAFSELTDRVVAFEANPDYAKFARRMLRGRAEVHECAISDRAGKATFRVPLSGDGMVLHYAGNLKNTHSQFANMIMFEVDLRTLDSFALTDVRFIKVDVEGSEREVLDGARATIMRDRSILMLELLSGTHADPGTVAAAICRDFGYDASLVKDSALIPALPAIAALGKNSTWGTDIKTQNVMFFPR